jgi:hypothetical protein
MDAQILAMADRALRNDIADPVRFGSDAAAAPAPSFFEKLHAALFRPALATAGIAAVVATALFLVNRGEAPSLLPSAAVSEDSFAPAPPLGEAAANTTPRHQASGIERESTAPLPQLEEGALPDRISAAPAARKRSAAEAASSLPYGDPQEQVRPGQPLNAVITPPASEKKKEAAMRDDGGTRSLTGGAPAAPKTENRVPASAGEDFSREPSPPLAPAPSQTDAPAGSASFTSGMAAYNRGNCTVAIADFQTVLQNQSTPPSEIPIAHHYIARCETRMGRCAKAVSHFDTVISRHLGYRDRPAALYEAADCHIRLGNRNRARTLLEELRTLPAWRARAESKLQEIE